HPETPADPPPSPLVNMIKRLVLALCFASSLVACEESLSPAANPAADPALTAFETVRQVLQHPRCQNCHPGGDAPLQGDDGHLHAQNVHRGKDGRGEIGAECTTCHGPSNPPSEYGAHIPPGNAKPWHMPPEDTKLVFVGVAPRALCEQIKDP